MEQEDIVIRIASKKLKCKNCIFATDNPFDCHCAKFILKPNDVYYEGKDCPKYQENTEDEEDE